MKLLRSLVIPVAIGAALAASASASAIDLSIQPDVNAITGEVFYIDGGDGASHVVAITRVELQPGFPDAVFGDTSAGIPNPIPPQCARVDPTIVRCPIDLAGGVRFRFGAGNDSLSVDEDFGYRSFLAASGAQATAPFVRGSFGAGADTGVDLSAYTDTWNGGPGKDRLNSGPGNDKVKGGAQNDVIDCGSGHHDVGIGGPGRLDLSRRCEVVKH